MSGPRVPGRRWCKSLSLRQLAALLFLGDCQGWHGWSEGYTRRPREFHTTTLQSLERRGLLTWEIEIREAPRDPPFTDRWMLVKLTPGGESLVAAYRYGYEAGLEA